MEKSYLRKKFQLCISRSACCLLVSKQDQQDRDSKKFSVSKGIMHIRVAPSASEHSLIGTHLSVPSEMVVGNSLQSALRKPYKSGISLLERRSEFSRDDAACSIAVNGKRVADERVLYRVQLGLELLEQDQILPLTGASDDQSDYSCNNTGQVVTTGAPHG